MSGTWKLADLAEKQDIEAIEAAFEDKQRVMEGSAPAPSESPDPSQQSTIQPSDTSSTVTAENAPHPATSKSAKRPRGWDQLTLLEKDVLVVLMAFCKVICLFKQGQIMCSLLE